MIRVLLLQCLVSCYALSDLGIQDPEDPFVVLEILNLTYGVRKEVTVPVQGAVHEAGVLLSITGCSQHITPHGVNVAYADIEAWDGDNKLVASASISSQNPLCIGGYDIRPLSCSPQA